MKFVYITAIIAVTALGAPTFALDIPEPEPQVIEAPAVELPAPDTTWTEQVQPAPTPQVIEPVAQQPIDTHVETPKIQASLIEAPRVQPLHIQQASYVKTEAQMRVLNTIPGAQPYGLPVPEPGTIAGMSAGLAGLLLQLRRSRNRS